METRKTDITKKRIITFLLLVFGILYIPWIIVIIIPSLEEVVYAAIIHGASDIIGEVGVWISSSTKSSLLGPAPTGIIGLSILMVGAVILFFKMPSTSDN